MTAAPARVGARVVIVASVATVAFGASACSKDPATTGQAPVASASASGPPSTGLAPRASASAPERGPAAAPAGTPATFKGTYEAAVGTFPLPANKDYDGLKWRGEKSESGLGKGAIELTLPAGPRGVVSGTLDGPLGPAVITGYLDGDDVTARFDPKEAAPERFAGGLVGKRKGDALEGTIDAAQDSKVLRTGPFSLKLTR
ncbi:MAG: hypothetical protein U0235_02435 [Polyangiaceae bacterium]